MKQRDQYNEAAKSHQICLLGLFQDKLRHSFPRTPLGMTGCRRDKSESEIIVSLMVAPSREIESENWDMKDDTGRVLTF